MPQKDQIFAVDRQFDKLEPAMNPEWARTDHAKLVNAGAGLTVTYRQGQVICQKNDGTNEWAKLGVAGYNTAIQRIIKYTITINETGQWQYGTSWVTGQSFFETSIGVYYRGYFKAQDLLGSNEVQTETVTATGGTRTLSFDGQTTAAIAFDANAAAIQAALMLLSNLAPGDVVVSGTGPFVYTFGGEYAAEDVPPLVVNPALLTGGTSTMAATGGGLADVGVLIRGTRHAGMVKFG